jgi:hypothetical protein
MKAKRCSRERMGSVVGQIESTLDAELRVLGILDARHACCLGPADSGCATGGSSRAVGELIDRRIGSIG